MRRHDATRLAVAGLLVLLLAPAMAAAQAANGAAAAAEGTELGPDAVLRLVPLLEAEIEAAMEAGGIPSCTVALVSRERILWTGAYGYANVWARTPATPQTVYLIGSTFKTLSTAAALQLVESGRLGLDEPVRRYLGGDLSIRNEDPTRPVTVRHLLTHTSGLPAAFGPHEVWGDSVPPPLAAYLAQALEVTAPPGQQVVYSNLAYTLLAYIVERVSGVPYRRYMSEEIFRPLGLGLVFSPTPQIEERLAVPYVRDAESGRPVAAMRLKADVWPAGIVYGTVGDQARWLRAVLRGGELDGKRILRSETVAMTLQRQFDSFAGPMHSGWGNDEAGYGLTWWTAQKGGDRHFAHSGSVPGYTAFLEGNADLGVGFAVLTNGHRAHPHLIRLADFALGALKREVEGVAVE